MKNGDIKHLQTQVPNTHICIVKLSLVANLHDWKFQKAMQSQKYHTFIYEFIFLEHFQCFN
jgi:hypothetical protein